MKKILLFVLFLLLIVSCSVIGDPYETHGYLDVNNLTGVTYIYPALSWNGHYPSPRITQLYTWYCFDDLGIPLEHSFSDELVVFDNFTLKFYSSEVTNAANWDSMYQDDLNMDDLEGLVYYATNISNGLSRPELFDSGNDLPFYLSTNSYRLEIYIKELQTNQ